MLSCRPPTQAATTQRPRGTNNSSRPWPHGPFFFAVPIGKYGDRLLSHEEFAKLSSDEKVAYLSRAIEAVKRNAPMLGARTALPAPAGHRLRTSFKLFFVAGEFHALRPGLLRSRDRAS